MAVACLNSPAAHLYHLSHGISGAEEEKEEKPFFENCIWGKFMALEETRGLIFNLEKQQMDNHTAVGLPSQAYHVSTAGKCSPESSEMCMFGSQASEHRTAVHFFPPPHSHLAGTTPRDRNQCQRICSSGVTGMEGDPAAISTGVAALQEALLERGIKKLLSDISHWCQWNFGYRLGKKQHQKAFQQKEHTTMSNLFAGSDLPLLLKKVWTACTTNTGSAGPGGWSKDAV